MFIECWNATKEITDYMQQKKFETNENGFIELWAEFHAKALEAWDQELEAANGTPPQPVMLWSSELTQAHRIQKHLSKER